MPFLRIDGVEYDVDVRGAAEAEPDYAGEVVSAMDESLRDGRRLTYRKYKFVLAPMTEATFEALRVKLDGGGFFSCDGDAVPTAYYLVRMTGRGYMQHGDLAYRRVAEVELRRAY